MRQSSDIRSRPRAAGRRSDDRARPEHRPTVAEEIVYEPPRVGFFRRTGRLLTFTVTIVVAALAVLLGSVYVLDRGKGAAPANAQGLSTNEMLALVRDVQVDPRTAYAVAAAKRRAYE